MKILEAVFLAFKNGEAKFGYLQKISDSNVEALAIDTKEGVTLPQGEYITQEQFNKCSVSLEKNNTSIINDMPVTFFQPTVLERWTDLPEGNGLDFNRSKVKYQGTPADVEGKLILFIFKYE